MKLSEMNTTDFAKALCDLAEPVSAILCSEDAKAALQNMAAKENEAPVPYLLRLFAEVVPVILDKHFEHAVPILSVLIDKPQDEIRLQAGLQTMKDIRGVAIPEIRALADMLKA